MTGRNIKNTLISAIKKKYKKSYKIAIDIDKILVDKLDIKIVEDEIAYLAMHRKIVRLSIDK